MDLRPGSGEGVELLGLGNDDFQARLAIATGSGSWSDGGLETDARALWLAVDGNAAQACGIVIDGSYLRFEGTELWRATGSSPNGGFEAPRAAIDSRSA